MSERVHPLLDRPGDDGGGHRGQQQHQVQPEPLLLPAAGRTGSRVRAPPREAPAPRAARESRPGSFQTHLGSLKAAISARGQRPVHPPGQLSQAQRARRRSASASRPDARRFPSGVSPDDSAPPAPSAPERFCPPPAFSPRTSAATSRPSISSPATKPPQGFPAHLTRHRHPVGARHLVAGVHQRGGPVPRRWSGAKAR